MPRVVPLHARARARPGALAIARTGEGPPLVLLHPLGADRHVWDPVVGLLAREREVLAVDLPGFGGSRPLADGQEATPRALAAAVAAELRWLGLERAHVAGNSLGGWVALELAAAGEASSVCAIAPAGLWAQTLSPRRGSGRSALRALRPALPALVAVPALRRAALSVSVAHPERVPYLGALRLLRAYAGAPGFHAADDAMRAGRFTALARIADVPVTLAWPEHDRMIARPRVLPPGVRSVSLPGCGHIPMWDDPELVAGVLLAASDAVGAAGSPQLRDGTARPANSPS